MGNITYIYLYKISKIKSVFTLPVASPILLETLSIKKCEELEHIIISNDDRVGNNMKDVFSKLRTLRVVDCEQLEYIFGLYSHGHQNQNEIHLSLPILKYLKLINLSKFIGMCPENYHTTLPALTNFEFHGYAKRTIKSIGHLVEELSGNVEYFLTLENLKVHDSQAEHIFCLDEMIGQQINLGMQKTQLGNMPQMTYVFKGPKNSFVLLNIVKIIIVRCEKLEVIFSASVSRCLPQLRVHHMSKCLSPRTCFPELQMLVVENCDKLNYVFPTSICGELPKLKALVIKEAYKLKEVFGGDDDQKVKIPNLIFVAFDELPSFCQGIQFQTTVHRWVFNCPQLSLTSALTDDTYDALDSFDNEFDVDWYFQYLHLLWASKMNTQVTNNESSITKTTEDAPEVDGASGHELTSSQGVKRNVEEGTTSANAKTPTSSTHSKSEDGDSQIILPSSSTINIKPFVTKDVDVGESQETTKTHALENSSQTMEDFASLIANELRQLVSKKYLTYENLSLLADFLVKHPSVRLTNNSFSNRYKGYAFNCLVELLKFLQTHSVLDVLRSSQSDFVELLQDVRGFSFDKDWLDVLERHALLAILQVYQDALQKLLDSKHNLIQHAEDLKHQVLQSIIQQEAQISEAKAALSAPLGY